MWKPPLQHQVLRSKLNTQIDDWISRKCLKYYYEYNIISDIVPKQSSITHTPHSPVPFAISPSLTPDDKMLTPELILTLSGPSSVEMGNDL